MENVEADNVGSKNKSQMSQISRKAEANQKKKKDTETNVCGNQTVKD